MIRSLLILLCSLPLLLGGSGAVWAAQVVSTTDGLISLLRRTVQAQYRIPEHDVLIIWADGALEQELSKMGARVSAQVPPRELERLIGKSVLMLDVYDKGVFRRKLAVKVKVDGWKEAYLTSREVARGETLDEGNIKKSRKLISQLPKNFLANADDIFGQVAYRNLPAETVLTSREVKARPLVLRGETVKVRVVNGSLTLLADGVAQEDGAKGQRIRVKIMTFSSAKLVMVQVLGTGEVLLEVK